MKHKAQVVVRAVQVGALPCLVWYLGWLSYDLFNLWDWLKPQEYMNVLGLSMAVSVFVMVELVRRSSPTALTSSRVNNPKPLADWVKTTDKRLSELEGKVTDLHVFKKLENKREKTKEET